ncbi:MAG: IclR family transcriptional regulator [Burkholderiales bacterium]|nr:IclR family transcriptional regulator [Burkholderiales bacterium]
MNLSEDGVSAADADHGGPRSVARLLALFDRLAVAPEGMSLADLSAALEAPKSSLLNLLRPLVAEGYVVHDGSTYHLGPSMFRLAASVLSSWNFPRLVRPFLTELSLRTAETAVLSRLDRRAEVVTYVEIIEGPHPVRYHIPVGTTRPILSTAAGKIMLAHADPGWREAFLRKTRFPVRGIVPVTRAALLEELDQVRSEGVAISLDRHIPGVSAIAAPVFGVDGECVAALTIAGPSQRIRGALDALVATIRHVAARASGAISSAGASLDV